MKKHRGRPAGMTYADELARKRMVRQAVEKSAHDHSVQLEADITTQRMSWLMVCSVADAFGIGAGRMQRFFDCLQENTDAYTKMVEDNDAEYANEKLRLRAEQVSGMKIKYLYEAEMREARERNQADGVFFESEKKHLPVEKKI